MSRWLSLEADLVYYCVYDIIVFVVENSVSRYTILLLLLFIFIITCVISFNDDIIITISDDNHRV